MSSIASSPSRVVSPPACPACGDGLPPSAQFCPGCGRPVKPLKGHDSEIGPRTDKPLTAVPNNLTETQTDLPEVAKFLPQRYKVLKKLGQGGMGTVYLCKDQALERQVAIKIMTDRYRADPQGERRFMREARAQATVNHPNVATVLNFGVSPEGRPFLVMEYLEGEDLRTLIRRNKVLEPQQACELLKQVCDGLEDAHNAGLVHRDLKPSNIMIIKDHRGAPWVKILDLGLAKIVGGQTDLKSITLDTAGMLVGTPAYMSPEQVAGAAVDGRADLYSVGVMFFEMLTGRLPFESETMEGWLYQHLHVKPPAPSAINPALARYPQLDQIVLWLMSKIPHERPKTAGELCVLLKRLIDSKLADGTARKSGPRAALEDNPPARRSGPRNALSFEDNPPARRSGPRPSLMIDTGAPPPPDYQRLQIPESAVQQSLPAVPAADKEADDRRALCLAHTNAAETAEKERRWAEALEHWEKALPVAEKQETVRPRIDTCRREIEFESQIGAAGTAASQGEWDKAEGILSRLASQRASDPRIEQAKARLPKRLVSAWLGLAAAKIKGIPEGDLRQGLLEHLGIAYAQTGDMVNSLIVLQDNSRKPEARVIGTAQAIAAAIQNGQHEGLRPYLDRVCAAASGLTDPSERGRAQLEVGRAMSAYGDQSSASAIFQSALAALHEAHGKGIPLTVTPRRNAGSVRRAPIDMRSITMTATSLTGPKAIKTSWEMAVGGVAQAQAEAGVVDDSLASATFIEDPWILAQTLSAIAQACSKIGRSAEAERVAGQITFALPKTQALRAVMVSRVYRGDLTGAEEILKGISTPADRIPILGLLAAAWALRSERGRAEMRILDASKASAEVIGARARFQALLAAAEPVLNAGFQDLAESLINAAQKLTDLMDDPSERMRSILHLAQVQETAKSAHMAATRTIIFTPAPSESFIEPLRKAMVIWRQVRASAARMECIERLAFCIAWGSAHDLASEMMVACRDDAEAALAYIGLSNGMA